MDVYEFSLKNGNTKSCGCLKRKSPQLPYDLTEKRFGKLRVEKRDGSRGGQTLWLCQCDCGNTSHVPTNRLVSGKTTSCGCYMIERGHILKEYNKNHTEDGVFVPLLKQKHA